MKRPILPLLIVLTGASACAGMKHDPDAAGRGSDLERRFKSPSQLTTVAEEEARKAKEEVEADRNPKTVSRASGGEGRPFGGVAVTAGSALWQAEIYRDITDPDWDAYHENHPEDHRPRWEHQHWCGATLIRDGWVLTAAHCVLVEDPIHSATFLQDQAKFLQPAQRQSVTVSKGKGVSLTTCVDAHLVADDFKVRLGAIEIDKPEGVSYQIDCAVVYTAYDPKAAHDDIALVHFSGKEIPAVGRSGRFGLFEKHFPTRSHPINWGADPPERNDAVSVFGWGKTHAVAGYAPSAVLLHVDLKVKDLAECAKAISEAGNLGNDVICAGAEAEKTCLGDSGGPVVTNDGGPVAVVGVVSLGTGACVRDGKPGIYTRVSAYSSWINDVLGAPLTADR